MADEQASPTEQNGRNATRPGTATRVLIAGGGTGGHLFPGLAIAEALQRHCPGVDIRFAGSSYGLEAREVPRRGYRLYLVPVRGLYGVSWSRRLLVLLMLPVAFLKCLGIILGFRPHLILGVGGYASAPVLATGLLLGRRCVIQEQNAYPGITNRLLGRFVHTAFTAVKDEHGFFRNVLVTGNPVRESILALRNNPQPGSETRGSSAEPHQVFVVGGSQGARVINRALTEALPLLRQSGPPLSILHQTGRLDQDWVREAYVLHLGSGGHTPPNGPSGEEMEFGSDLRARVTPFIEDMAAAYSESRLVISRAGASAVGEIVAARRASVLIPIPGTSGEHQLRNAERLAAAGAAVLLRQHDLNGERLAAVIADLLGAPERIKGMEEATDQLFPGDSADEIARACLRIIG
ncbi:MAG: UDP-N-acetylglucosamine--N-acetylmuramyl-(pentapeptide) pyrophosphoryl-undecaprenol N-acetylglucosamine transferase [Deltaproteobacteria bacterium]|nr:UDP-N-acetylglucosamine--N-acetylmuramyl-(pentapeptide) pyrophosphoryl-undecaprenol N-acetylglucosamine transferase [Deltaproteobacteria bacterium]